MVRAVGPGSGGVGRLVGRGRIGARLRGCAPCALVRALVRDRAPFGEAGRVASGVVEGVRRALDP